MVLSPKLPLQVASKSILKIIALMKSVVLGPNLRPRQFHWVGTKAIRSTDTAHGIWKEVLRRGDTAVDATCGKGRDMAVLCRLLSTGGRVVGMDVQPTALSATRAFLSDVLSVQWKSEGSYEGSGTDGLELELLLKSHEYLKDSVEEAKVICFNLGYLPYGDKDLTTKVSSTLVAVEAATDVVVPGGVVTVMAYPGHEEGRRERDALREMFEKLPTEKWCAVESTVLNRVAAPVLTALYRL